MMLVLFLPQQPGLISTHQGTGWGRREEALGFVGVRWRRPTRTVTDQQHKLVQEGLENGGRVFLMVSPYHFFSKGVWSAHLFTEWPCWRVSPV